jgi:2-succinyl-5-enolpyruvyl-6-hydroxy-3-cyclohexene-1-carboxylate synthase
MSQDLNTWWADLVIAQLAAADCGLVVLCPGNRDLPLLAAVARGPLTFVSHVDERSAAFIALGFARASGQAAAVVTTSGTALANCLPALCEADLAGIPLVVISADRPRRLHHCGAPQTMPQAGRFDDWCAGTCAAPEPKVDLADSFIADLAEALTKGLRRPGPVHLNLPFDDPLVPTAESVQTTLPTITAKTIRIEPSSVSLDPTALEAVAQAKRGVIVIGPDCPVSNDELRSLAASGWPILSDAVGSTRFDQQTPGVVSSADALLAGRLKHLKADCMIRLGPAPIARPVFEWLSRQRVPVLRFDRLPVEGDFCHEHFINLGQIRAEEWSILCDTMAPAPADWRQLWEQAEREAQATRYAWLQGQPWNECQAAAIACSINCPDNMVLAASMPVRHGNLHLVRGVGTQRVFANRGVNGIDGTIGTAIGISRALGPTRLLIGDLALLHDLPALDGIAQAQLEIVVLANGGGRIFDLLPVGKSDRLAELVRTPSRIQLPAIATAFGMPCTLCSGPEDLTNALGRPGLVIAPVDGDESAAAWKSLLAAMGADPKVS